MPERNRELRNVYGNGSGMRGTVYFQYDYRAEDGTLFSCVKPSLELCREARDKFFCG